MKKLHEMTKKERSDILDKIKYKILFRIAAIKIIKSQPFF